MSQKIVLVPPYSGLSWAPFDHILTLMRYSRSMLLGLTFAAVTALGASVFAADSPMAAKFHFTEAPSVAIAPMVKVLGDRSNSDFSAIYTPVLVQESLRDMRAQQQEEMDLQREAAYTANVCDIRLSATINWGRSRNWPENRSLAAACDDALSALEAVCRGGLKKQVQEQISSFQCYGDGSGPNLTGGTLRYGAGASGGYTRTRDYLEQKLGD